MKKDINYLEEVGRLEGQLRKKGLEPVLVGGMALVVLGSPRITNDFDFLISFQDTALDAMVDIFYREGFELISKCDKNGDVLRTIGNSKVAAARIKMDTPHSVFFYNATTELKVDLLFDFPLPAKEVASRAIKFKIKSRSLRLASLPDLIRLKEIAYADRGTAADAQDLEFLRHLAKTARHRKKP